ncbi:TRAP transporter large permease subunit [Kaistia dalseonensis]|uniref:TRAP-type mannitol/chloroaromatic compound transport system permease large subunit n=1 Tax=Kaistia dalseonensis TaxID=410840 RepID=A0ABU0HB45_9HYPH|nr:TRAP transporter large permease subunit [Kaistia dalseonensis]MCX5496859.1 TRAP transporter large permease subunit [Kaistia dalseonensis]MDQ0439485.1 TRAP-type mannitol/chloroaromatic compound transport system permease large subunit [Kaistia dalseonensis]
MLDFIAANIAPIMFGALIIMLLIGYPVAFALAATGLGFGLVGMELGLIQTTFFQALPERIFDTMRNETLLAIPFFTFMGLILERSGMAEDLLETVGQLFGPIRGGLAYAVVFVGALLAATTGVVAASVIAMGLISLPIMLRYGYDRRLAAGVIAASGTLAQIIPPSLVLIIMADQLGRSVGDMYAGALVPGLLLAVFYAGYIFLVTRLSAKAAPGLPPEAQTLREKPADTDRKFYWPLALALALLTTFAMVRLWGAPGLTASLLPEAINAAAWSVGGVIILTAFFRGMVRVLTASLVILIAIVAVLSIFFDHWLVGRVQTGSEMIVAASAAFVVAYVVALANKMLGVHFLSRLAQEVILVLMPPLALIFLVLGTIFIGLATPTEGGAMGAVGALVLAAAKRRLSFESVKHALDSTTKLSAFVLFILIGSRTFTLTFFGVNGHKWVEHLLVSLPGGELGFLVVVNLLVFFLAFFLDYFELAFIIVPLLAPVADKLGIDLIWFGVLLAINMQTSFMHPPFGFSLFYLRSVAAKVPYLDRITGRSIAPVTTGQIYAGAIPFVLIQIIMVVITIAFPGIVTHYKTEYVAPALDQNAPPPGLDLPGAAGAPGLDLPSPGGAPGLDLPAPGGAPGLDQSPPAAPGFDAAPPSLDGPAAPAAPTTAPTPPAADPLGPPPALP